MPIQKITKEEILEKAGVMFAKRGFYAVSMKDLQEDCGILKGSFYHYFSSKEALGRAVLEFALNYIREHIFSIAYNDQLPVRERLQKMLEKHGRLVVKNQQGCLFAIFSFETGNATEEFREVLEEFFLNWKKALNHLFQKKYTAEEAEELSEKTMMEMEGAVMFFKLNGNETWLKKCIERAVKLI